MTTVSGDPNDLEPLTPNHLLLLKSESPLSSGLFKREDSLSRRRWKQVQYLADVLWRRWSREYLPLLQLIGKSGHALKEIWQSEMSFWSRPKLPIAIHGH